jgi:protein TonB
MENKTKRISVKSIFMRCFFVCVLFTTLHTSIFAQQARSASREPVFAKPETEAEFAGGPGAWLRFLQKNLFVPQNLVDNEFVPSVRVKFLVYKSGKIGTIEMLTKTDTTWSNEIKRFIALSDGQWLPAMNGGKKVNSYKIMPIIICLSSN